MARLRSTVEGAAVGVAAVVAMLAVAVVGVGLAVPGAQARGRMGAAVVALAVGAPVEVTASGTAVPGSDRLPVRGGLPVAVSGTVDVRPLGVTLVGVVALVLLVWWRHGVVRRATGGVGVVVGFVGAVCLCASLGRGGPVDVERVSVAFRAGVGSAVVGALVLVALVLLGCLLPAVWRRPVVAVAAVVGALGLLATVVGLVVGAVNGGARVAGAALLGGAGVIGAVPWSLGVPWRFDLTGPLAGPLAARLDELGTHHGGRWGVAVVGTVAIFSSAMLTTERGWPAAARLGAAWAVGFAAVTVATAASATATATVFVVRLPAAEISLRGNVFVAVVVGAVAGTIAGLVPARPRVGWHGVSPRRR